MKPWQWTVYYDTGKTRSNTAFEVHEIDPFGVIAIVQKDHPSTDRVVVTAGDDFYYYDEEDGRWYGVELTGLMDYLIHKKGLKMGRFIPIEDYELIMDKAIKEAQTHGL